jgi:CRISPR-associated endonuclease/helicase Cas3
VSTDLVEERDVVTNDLRKNSFTHFFKTATGGCIPYEWQTLVAIEGLPDVLPIPTGLGKTEVALAWAWRLLANKQPEPLHLVYCLPMRSLVTQTTQRLKAYFDNLRAKWPEIDVEVYQLMGGAIDDEWIGHPDKPWVLVGTQDQLLSRALNRGYAMSRFEWPVHFGLLNNDCRWLIDEVQLMGPGLWTTAQLDWMRRKRFPSLKPCLTTWMSATVGTSFLGTTDRKRDAIADPSNEQVEFERKLDAAIKGDQQLGWWRAAKRPLAWWQPEAAAEPATRRGKKRGAAKSAAATSVTPDTIAASVRAKHMPGTLTLVICNTVEMARSVFRALSSIEHKVLLTSRFRREDRARHEQRLIDFDARRKAGTLSKDDPGLICVSTQVIEAGIDISAHRLFTELAPWPSMLQRLGRLNRKGDDQDAQAWVWETPKEGGNKKIERIGPYEATDIDRAKKLVDAFAPLSQREAFSDAIARLSTNKQKEVTEALQPRPSPLPRALDVHGLFSTERDVHGGFTDISAFVRGTDPDLDVTVFWRDWDGDAPPRGEDLDGPLLDPANEGCPVSFVRVQEMLESSKAKAWLWDDEADQWERVNYRDIRPGMLVMLKRDVGGYDATEGWTGDKSSVLTEVPRAGRGETLRDDTRTEAGYWSKLEDHLADASREAKNLCDALSLTGDLQRAVVEAAGLHDLGKAHPQWQAALTNRGPFSAAEVLAKTPRGSRPFRPGLRHEAASALAMWRKYHHSQSKPYPALAVYLAAAHHGKVRTVMRSTTDEGDDVFGVPSEPRALVISDTEWPLDFSIAKDGAEGRWEGNEFVMTGPGWTGLVADLLGPWRPEETSEAGAVPEGEPRQLGPFALAYLEVLVRIADWRASRCPSARISPRSELSIQHENHGAVANIMCNTPL